MTNARLLALIEELRALPGETSWAEFKTSNDQPSLIGKLISALSNAARLEGRDFGYVVWGIRDDDRHVVGTSFQPDAAQSQRQPLAFWLAQRLRPDVPFSFETVDHPDGKLVLMEVPAATTAPVEFDETAYIRIGSATPRLAGRPERQRALWDKLRPYVWETGIAMPFVASNVVLELRNRPNCRHPPSAPKPAPPGRRCSAPAASPR